MSASEEPSANLAWTLARARAHEALLTLSEVKGVEPADRLRAVYGHYQNSADVLVRSITDTLDGGGSWSTVAGVLQISKQTAHNRYAQDVAYERERRERAAERLAAKAGQS